MLLPMLWAIIGKNKGDCSLSFCGSVSKELPLKIDQVFILIFWVTNWLIFTNTKLETEARWRNSEHVVFILIVDCLFDLSISHRVCGCGGISWRNCVIGRVASASRLNHSPTCIYNSRAMFTAFAHKFSHRSKLIITFSLGLKLSAIKARSVFAPLDAMRAKLATILRQLLRYSLQVSIRPLKLVIARITSLSTCTDRPLPSLGHLWKLRLPWRRKSCSYTIIIVGFLGWGLTAFNSIQLNWQTAGRLYVLNIGRYFQVQALAMRVVHYVATTREADRAVDHTVINHFCILFFLFILLVIDLNVVREEVQSGNLLCTHSQNLLIVLHFTIRHQLEVYRIILNYEQITK